MTGIELRTYLITLYDQPSAEQRTTPSDLSHLVSTCHFWNIRQQAYRYRSPGQDHRA